MPKRRLDFLDTTETAQILRLKKHTMENMRCKGHGPIFYKLVGRVFYRRADLRAVAGEGPTALLRPARNHDIVGLLGDGRRHGAHRLRRRIADERPMLIWNASPSLPVGTLSGRACDAASARPRARSPASDASRTWPHAVAISRTRPTCSSPSLPSAATASAGWACTSACAAGSRPVPRCAIAWGAPCRAGRVATGLRTDELFLLAEDPDSFDSRYFGAVSGACRDGRAVLIWSLGRGICKARAPAAETREREAAERARPGAAEISRPMRPASAVAGSPCATHRGRRRQASAMSSAASCRATSGAQQPWCPSRTRSSLKSPPIGSSGRTVNSQGERAPRQAFKGAISGRVTVARDVEPFQSCWQHQERPDWTPIAPPPSATQAGPS